MMLLSEIFYSPLLNKQERHNNHSNIISKEVEMFIEQNYCYSTLGAVDVDKDNVIISVFLNMCI